jgi:L-rhamnose-H+ transport protein
MGESTPGLLIALIAGAIGSAVLLPMKFVRGWAWEAMWLAYAVFAYLSFPWVVAVATIPDLRLAYEEAGWQPAVQTAAAGAFWGAGVVCFGLAIDRLGLSLGYAVIMGLSIVVGSLTPLVVSGGGEGGAGLSILGSDAVILLGLFLSVGAGAMRADSSARGPAAGEFWVGLALAVFSGVTASLISFALALGAPITDRAVAHGASSLWKANAVWALAVSAGSVPSLVFCGWLLQERRGWDAYRAAGARANLGWCFLMGVAFMASTVLYGTATGLMRSDIATAVGWPVYIGSIILGTSFWGWCFGEWKGASRASIGVMLAGVAAQVVGIALLNRV